MAAIYRRFAGARSGMADETYAAKRLIMQVSMASEINQLGDRLDRISERNRLFRDFTLPSLARALREVIAAFPVYRTYVGEDGGEPSARDRAYIEHAVASAERRNPTVNVSVFDFVRDALLLRYPAAAAPEERAERRHFAMRFQQLTGPVTAKGVEDTAHYRYNRLVSLNEVGSDPARFGEPTAVFHDKNGRRLARWPDTLLATATHDTKRGEDVRARINVLSEVPELWSAEVRRWRAIARRFKREVDGQAAPDRNDEYLLFQTLVGAWPQRDADESLEVFTDRIRAYMEKATKEAKVHTSWVNPYVAYDDAVRGFVTRLLAPASPFIDTSRPFREAVASAGAINSLAQTLLKITAPGIPDFYQGSELWDLSLVDPDNRRPVDFARRQSALDGLAARIAAESSDSSALATELLASWPDGVVKLYVIHRALTLRRARSRLFGVGAYVPLAAVGARGEHVVAFARCGEGEAAIVAVPRLSARLTGLDGGWPLGEETWGETWLSLGDAGLAGTYRDRFTGRRLQTEPRDGVPGIPLGALLEILPVALLEREDAV
jgi:(1->4)-alpha-D-glucan 1-alpha-D-glucosylmutase